MRTPLAWRGRRSGCAPRAFAEYREMIELARPHLVSVAPRQPHEHHAMVLAALRAGTHVYCEKPFTSTLAEADELLAESERLGLKIAVAHQLRLQPTVTQLKRLVADPTEDIYTAADGEPIRDTV